MTKVSVIVRTFNSGETIRRLLHGLSVQRFDDYEIVVVDSGSTDGTLEAIREHPHTFVDYSGRRFSYSGTLNAGIEASSGEYVVCLSHHCVPLHEEWLGSLVEAMENDERLAGAWGPLVFDLKSYQIGKKDIEVIDLEGFLQRPNLGLQNPNSIVRRRLWEERPFSEEVGRCEDQDWAHHFMKRGYNTAVVHNAPVLYAPKFGLYEYAGNTYRNLMTLNRMFGYVPVISTRELLRQTARFAGAAALGERESRASGLAISGMIGRWIAYRSIQYWKLKRLAEEGAAVKRGLAVTRVRTRLGG